MNGNHYQQIRFHLCKVNWWVTFDVRNQTEEYIHFLLYYVINNDIHPNELQ